MPRRYLPFIAIFLSVLQLSAAPDTNDPYSLQHYDNRNGLSNSSINDLFIDAGNLLWVATWDGLNLYNGSSFHVFNYSRESDSHSIGSNVIQKVTEDKLGNIWITTIEGISRYAKTSGRFYHYFYNQDGRARVSENEYALAVDTAGTVYCFSKKNGLNVYDPAADRFSRCMQPAVANGIFTNLFFDSLNRLWLLNSKGVLDILDGNTFKRISESTPVKNVDQLFRTRTAVFFTTTDQQLFTVNGRGAAIRLMKLPARVAAIGEYQHHFLLAWTGRGCGIYNEAFNPDGFLGEQAKQLANIHITSFTTDSEQILWCGTDGSGIIKVYPRTKPFGTISTSDNGIPYNRSVRAFCETGSDLWVGTKGSGIMVFSDFHKVAGISRKQVISTPVLDNNSVYALRQGIDGLLYVGSDGKGICVYDQRSKRFYKWNEINGTTGQPEFGSVYAIRQDPDRSLWIGTSGYGLIHLTVDRNNAGGLTLASIEKFTFSDDDHGPANDIIYSIEDGGNGLLWIGCRYGGLTLMNKKKKSFKTFKAFAYDGSLSNNDVLSLFRDSRNRLWVGTSYGLNWADEEELRKPNPVFSKLTTEQGLPNNTIHAIEQDSAGQIWISSNKGLACINDNGKISYYQQVDGLQSNEFSDGAVYRDRQGMLYFGGISGFNQFVPADIGRSSWQPNLLISGMVVGDSDPDNEGYRVVTDTSANPLSFSVGRNANYFQADIKALSYLNAEKCEYAYYLEGYDKTWRYTGTNGQVNYSNLLPGNYVFHVKWTNGEGAWSGEKVLFRMEVLQFIWLRWYALLLYGLVAFAICVTIYRYRKNKQVIRHQLEVEHLLRERDEAAHRSRIGFFTNIAHELQTPLTLIMGGAERFREMSGRAAGPKENSYFLSLIYQQASKLTYMVHQLLDFRKSEEGFGTNKYAFFNLSALLQNLSDAFVPLAEKGKTEFDIAIEGNLSGWTDKDKLEKIIYNLLSNAFKYAATNEQITFNASADADGQLQLAITNPCTPLTPEELSHLFDEFYIARERGNETIRKGTGIGLAFTRQLVNLLQGNIRCSYEDHRITFSVALPLRQPVLAAIPAETTTARHQPSSLYNAITAAADPLMIIPPVRNNKSAIIEGLQPTDRKTILLVEDDDHIRFLLKDILQEEYIIHEATDGIEAIGLIEKLVPDLVICDVMMPNMNGLELCNRVKNAPATCHVPFMMLSARGSEDHHLEGYEVGADAYIAKPFQTGHLKRRVTKLIEYRQRLIAVFNQPDGTLRLADTDLPADDKLFLTSLASVIGEHLSEPELNAVFLEKHFNLSKMQLYRRLKTMTGMTPGEFIRHVRLKDAAALLTSTNLSVTEIFFRTGFNNQSYFYREFRKKYQYAPNEYREMRKAL